MARFLLPLILALTMPASAAIARSATPGESEKILKAIRAGAKAHYASYQGVRARRMSLTHEIDPATGKTRREIKAVTEHTAYYHRRPVIKVLSCLENGKPTDVKKCRAKKPPEPMWPVFGPRSNEHYRLRVLDLRSIGGRDYWRIRVSPRRSTARHFRGFVFFSKKDLRLKEMRGGPAALKFGVKSMSTRIRFRALGKVPVIRSGSVRLRVKVPLVFNAIVKVRFSESGHRLIRR